MKILAAVDGSFNAIIAARYSFVLAKVFNAKLFVATVIPKDMSKAGQKETEQGIEKILQEGREMELNIEGVIMKGDVVAAIADFARNNNLDIVVASTRKPHGDKRFFVESITSRLMAKVPCSVIGIKITNPGRSINPKKILMPVIGDGYKDKERAEIAEAFSRIFESRITVFHVTELKDSHLKKLDRQEKERLSSSEEKRISSLIEALRERGINFSEKIAVGRSAREEIIYEASHHKYDLIIAGATTRNIIKRIVSGNPVEEILRDTPCDVMLVHFK